MEQVWKFEANDGWKFSLALERERHRLCLEAAKGGLVWKMFAEDMLDNTEDHPSSFCLEARDKGRYWLFHSGTQVVLEQDGWTLHTCPMHQHYNSSGRIGQEKMQVRVADRGSIKNEI